MGGWRTQLQAAEICTFSIGGDSYIRFGMDGQLLVGPQKAQPLCVAGSKYLHLLKELKTFKKEKAYELFSDEETDCFYLIKKPKNIQLNEQHEKVIQLLEEMPHSLFYLAEKLQKDAESLGLCVLVEMGVLQRIAVTPTDILHVMGRYTYFDETIALTGVEILANKAGKSVSAFTQMVYSRIIEELVFSFLQSIADFEKQGFVIKDNGAAMYYISKTLRKEQQSLLQTEFKVTKPVVAIGAPAQAWMIDVCEKLYTKAIIPEHAEVANAVGAAVGQVVETAEALIRPGREHKYFVLHAPWAYKEFDTLQDALNYAIPSIKQYISVKVRQAGSMEFEIVESHEDIYTEEESSNTKTYIETRIKASAFGSPVWIT